VAVAPTESPTETQTPAPEASPSDTPAPVETTAPPAPYATLEPGTTVQVDPTSVQTVQLDGDQLDFFGVGLLLIVFAAAAVLGVKL
jgi:hypothetical protein